MKSTFISIFSSRFRRIALLVFTVCYAAVASATCGGVDYSQGAGALATMTEFVTNMMGYTVMIIYSFASILSIISALQIFVKINTGEANLSKEIVRLLGAILMLIGSTAVLPAFFGFHVF